MGNEHLVGRDERLAAFAREAVAIERKHGIPARLAVGQWAVESRWGFDTSGSHNYWGITFNPKIHPGFEWIDTHEELTLEQIQNWPDEAERATMVRVSDLGNGRFLVKMRRRFAAFPDLAAALAEYARLLTKVPKYAEPLREYLRFGNFEGLVRAIAKHWATGASYADLVLQIAKQGNVTRAIERARGR